LKLRLGMHLVVALAVVLTAATAQAAPRSLPLDPAHATVGFRAYAGGNLPIGGRFTRFNGVLVYDADQPEGCRVDMTIKVASLQLPDAALRDDVLSASLLNAAVFPTLAYSGECCGARVDGVLTMHGVGRPLSLAIQRDRSLYVAQATLRRADWSVTGRPFLAGQTVRIRISTTLPSR
jgi:polyisoprenoid-binding protein YceI